ncbi:hypothetical protein NECAME_06539 [Necator americanus]|uniref:SCP domain-containing protein n=1 Tax=Necator americanus TaxID=51031 RepID=W2TST7_NECAM|nr:hypothetical protein NECAME_06539 [Necator americanus]ETN85150.1 hypothetical protein NECAME_06539 [Necator americanus]
MSASTALLCGVLVLLSLPALKGRVDDDLRCPHELGHQLKEGENRKKLFEAVRAKYAYMTYNCAIEVYACILWGFRFNAVPEHLNKTYGLYPLVYHRTETNQTVTEFFKEAADKWRNETLNDWYGHRQMGCDFEMKNTGNHMYHNYTVFCFFTGKPGIRDEKWKVG